MKLLLYVYFQLLHTLPVEISYTWAMQNPKNYTKDEGFLYSIYIIKTGCTLAYYLYRFQLQKKIVHIFKNTERNKRHKCGRNFWTFAQYGMITIRKFFNYYNLIDLIVNMQRLTK